MLEPGDVGAWAALRCALWPTEDRGELTAEAEGFLTRGDALLRAVLVAEHPEAGVVGMAELGMRPYAEGCSTSPVAFLEGWYVAEGHRGLGIGGGLVAAAERWAAAQGCSEFASDAEVDNALSAAAHRALGFAEVGVIRCFRKPIGGQR